MSTTEANLRTLDHLRTPGLAATTRPFCEAGWLAPRHVFVIDRLARVFGDLDPERLLWFALVLEAQDRGHSALHVNQAAELLKRTTRRADEEGAEDAAARPDPVLPAVDALRLGQSGFVHGEPPPISLVVHTDGAVTLQTHRMGLEEQWVADALHGLGATCEAVDFRRLAWDPQTAAGLFDDAEHPGVAAIEALCACRVVLVTGGPGTGKTWTLVRILAYLFERWPAGQPVVALAAPTGKAAVRMEEAIGQEVSLAPSAGIHGLSTLRESTRRALSDLRGTTLHRLLKIRPDRAATRFGPESPLDADVVVVDEASMMDLTLTRKLLRALKPSARLVLVGDRDQLPSVEVGSVLGDLDRAPRLVTARLTEIRRTDVPELKHVVLAMQGLADLTPERAAAATALCEAPDRATNGQAAVARLAPSDSHGVLTDAELAVLLRDWLCEEGCWREVLEGWIRKGRHVPTDSEVTSLFQAFDRMRVLAVHRRGPSGVSGLRARITRLLQAPLASAWANAHPGERRAPYPTQHAHWLGEPILVTRNRADLDLYNGDVGLVIPGPDRSLVAAFPGYGAQRGQIRRVQLPRLPEHETAVVMTVHKSQGSQFRHAVVVLSPEPSPIQTRELVYTGLSRASHRMTWVGREDRLREALGSVVSRGSLLGNRLGNRLAAPLPAQPAVGARLADTATHPGSAPATAPLAPPAPVEPPPSTPASPIPTSAPPAGSPDSPSPQTTATGDRARTRLSDFLREHLPSDGSVVSARALNEAAEAHPTLTRELVEQELTTALAAGWVVKKERSYALAPSAPAPLDSALARATRVVLDSDQPLAKSDIVELAGLDEESWVEIRELLWKQPAVVCFGRTRGTRYASQAVFERMEDQLRQELRAERGAEPQGRTVRKAFEERHGKIWG